MISPMPIRALLLIAVLCLAPSFSSAATTVAASNPSSICKNPDQYDATGMMQFQQCQKIMSTYDNWLPAFKARDCNASKGWDAQARKICTSGSNCKIGYIPDLIRQIGSSCCKDNWDACTTTAPPKRSSICKNPELYNGTAEFGAGSGQSCDFHVAQLDILYAGFKARDCDATKGWDSKANKPCNAGPNCDIGFDVRTMKQMAYACCQDRWSACSAAPAPEPSSVCKNPAQFDSEAKWSGDLTCGAVFAHIPPPAKSACTDARMRATIELIGQKCCKDKWSTCASAPPAAASPEFASICKSRDQYVGTTKLPARYGGQTCDALIGANEMSYPDFKARKCDPNLGRDLKAKTACTGGSGCVLGMARMQIRQFALFCCKDKWSTCTEAPPKPAPVCLNAGQFNSTGSMQGVPCHDYLEAMDISSPGFEKRDCTAAMHAGSDHANNTVRHFLKQVANNCCKDKLDVCTGGFPTTTKDGGIRVGQTTAVFLAALLVSTIFGMQ